MKWSALAPALLLAACSPAGDAVRDQAPALPTSGQAAHSEGLYAANCASCHDNGSAGAPKRDAIERMAPRRILAALTSGVMQAQGAALAPVDRVLLSEYLGRNAALEVAEAGRRCDGRLSFSGSPLWNRWGNSLTNTRFQPAAAAGISADEAPRLELAWAFAFPEAARARSQPAVTAEAIFTGSQSGRVYALDTQSGCIWWSYDAGAEVRSAPTIATDARGRPTRLYFGDFAGTVHAVDAATGEGIWRRSVRDHPDGTITGSVTLHEGRLFVPMSSTEIVSAINPDYACCTFRGGVTALAAADGRPLWRMHTTEEPRSVGATRVGTVIMAPSGAPVWSTP
ncbi:MAG: PQQ-binding-like beta-propeller repeat protein, partial [Sphingopyxis sp.]|nr:PQQ-binding-like beta-propeller repeat protein [Sphingopyxis sp.]